MVFGFLALRVVVNDALRLVARHLDDLSVAGYVGNLQVEGHSALLRAFKVAGPAQFQVSLGNAEAVVGVAHDVDACGRFLGQLVVCHEDAERLVGAASHASAQLVQLARDEAQRIVDDDPKCEKAEYQMLWNRLAELRKTNINWAAIS